LCFSIWEALIFFATTSLFPFACSLPGEVDIFQYICAADNLVLLLQQECWQQFLVVLWTRRAEGVRRCNRNHRFEHWTSQDNVDTWYLTSEALLKRHHRPLRLADSYSKSKIIYKRGYISKTYVIREIESKTREHVLITQRKNTEWEVKPIFHENLRTISREMQKVKLMFKQLKRGYSRM